MKRLLLLSIGLCFADNIDIYTQAHKLGEQHQFNLNLNYNSTISTYGQANRFERTVADNASLGNANAKNMYDNTYGDKADPNYLYKEGVKEITACQDKTDARCTTLNKYGDKDTQTQIQAYTQGFSERYSITVKPDPIDSACSTIIRKEPINPTVVNCISSAHVQTTCNSVITLSLDYHDCDPNNGGCNIYQNANCQLVKPFVQGKCHYDCDSSYHGTSPAYCPYWQDAYGHDTNWVSGSCTINEEYYCSAVRTTVICGTNAGGGSPNWHVSFSDCTQKQLATYACKVVQYSDGCSGFKP